MIMPVASGAEALFMPLAGSGDVLAATLPHGSGLALSHWLGLPEESDPLKPRKKGEQGNRGRVLGRLTLHSGTFNLGMTRPTGLAYSHERRLIAVANRSGGVHLVAISAGPVAVAAR